jgi:hypothetical protein
MFDKIIKKNYFSLAPKPKNLSLPPKIRSSNLKKKVITSGGYFINTMD